MTLLLCSGVLCAMPAGPGGLPAGAVVAAGAAYSALHLPSCLDRGVLHGELANQRRVSQYFSQ